MKQRFMLAVSFVTATLSACASLPPATVNYYRTKTNLTLHVLRTLTCNGSGELIDVSIVTPNVTNTADTDQAQETLNMGEVKGALSDTDITVTLTDDGRLLSINGTSNGEGEAALKTAVTVASTLATAGTSPIRSLIGLIPLSALINPGPISIPTGPALTALPAPDASACNLIAATTGGGKSLSLIYEGTIDFKDHKPQPIPLLKDYGLAIPDYNNQFKLIWANIGSPKISPVGQLSYDTAGNYAKQNNKLKIALVQPATVEVKVTAERMNHLLYVGTFPVGQLGKPYEAYFAKPASFGKETLMLSFTDAGMIHSIQYVKNTGATSAMNVVGAAAAEKQTAEQQELTNTKTKIDSIIANRKLALCMADNTQCAD
jgi:hypothetical protein